jgi:dTDP-4-dehydrorhamnose reductase
MKVAVIGGNGQLGSDMVDAFRRAGDEVRALTHEDIRVDDIDSVKSALTALHPDLVVNTAAYHNVPHCEADPTRSYQVNALGALNVARVAEDLGAANIYASTDYVFDGRKAAPYLEHDLPHPLNVYGVTKLSGEHYTLGYGSRPFVLRVSGIYGTVPCRAKGGNFITTMKKLAAEKPEVRVVTDEVLTPTPTREIAASAVDIVRRGKPGVYHLTCEGECSWYDFARVIFDTLGLQTPLLPRSVTETPVTVKRPFYSVLENGTLKSQGLRPLPHWKDALVGFLTSPA